MIETKRIASIGASVVENLRKLDLTSIEMQEVLLVATQLAMIETARMNREIQHRLTESQMTQMPRRRPGGLLEAALDAAEAARREEVKDE